MRMTMSPIRDSPLSQWHSWETYKKERRTSCAAHVHEDKTARCGTCQHQWPADCEGGRPNRKRAPMPLSSYCVRYTIKFRRANADGSTTTGTCSRHELQTGSF